MPYFGLEITQNVYFKNRVFQSAIFTTRGGAQSSKKLIRAIIRLQFNFDIFCHHPISHSKPTVITSSLYPNQSIFQPKISDSTNAGFFYGAAGMCSIENFWNFSLQCCQKTFNNPLILALEKSRKNLKPYGVSIRHIWFTSKMRKLLTFSLF